ncbi:hypothetical protein GCM10010372_74610 [Streptomyces tauricus]|nr:hypothetical protein GCM10010372_74610 [Streptomyces tauricus]
MVHPVGGAGAGGEVDPVGTVVVHDLGRPDLTEPAGVPPHLLLGRAGDPLQGGRGPHRDPAVHGLGGDVEVADLDDAGVGTGEGRAAEGGGGGVGGRADIGGGRTLPEGEEEGGGEPERDQAGEPAGGRHPVGSS